MKRASQATTTESPALEELPTSVAKLLSRLELGRSLTVYNDRIRPQ